MGDFFQKIHFEDMSYRFDQNDWIFQNLTFEFPLNRTNWIQAEEGEGRSTLLQLLAGLLGPTQGSYWINDQNVTEMSFEEFLPYRKKIGYGFDSGGLIHNRTLKENLLLPIDYHRHLSPPEAREKVSQLLQKFGLSKYADQRPSVVPGRVRKLVCLLRAVVLDPEVVLLDDPTVGLGQETCLQYFDYLETLRKLGFAKHIFVSSFDEHFMNLIEHETISIFEKQIHLAPSMPEKKVVNL